MKKGRVKGSARRETGIVSFLTPVWNYIDALVHPAAQHDALTAARHRAFIAPRLLGSFAALACFPLYIALRGVPSTRLTFAGLLPIALLRDGRRKPRPAAEPCY